MKRYEGKSIGVYSPTGPVLSRVVDMDDGCGTRAVRRPLRRIVGYEENENGVTVEVLECGHRQHPRQDMAGETNAVRRRCRRCKPT